MTPHYFCDQYGLGFKLGDNSFLTFQPIEVKFLHVKETIGGVLRGGGWGSSPKIGPNLAMVHYQMVEKENHGTRNKHYISVPRYEP